MVLVEAGLLAHPLLYLSQFIDTKEQHYESILNVTAHREREEGHLCLLAEIDKTSWVTAQKIATVIALQNDLVAQARDIIHGSVGVHDADR